MADAVTQDNPKPVKLKFEKVYNPCILQTKKRYVGYMYESVDQKTPTFDAKGIETVRRDGCPAGAKILEKSLRLLFESENVSLVKQFVQLQFNKISEGKMPIQDLIFAREFRGMSGYRPGACVPALELARRALRTDRMAVPASGWRVPYVIVYGEPGRPLIHSVRCPLDVVEARDAELRPNAVYYITKLLVPMLNRCFSLCGVDVGSWYNALPRHQTKARLVGFKAKGVIPQIFRQSDLHRLRKRRHHRPQSPTHLSLVSTATATLRLLDEPKADGMGQKGATARADLFKLCPQNVKVQQSGLSSILSEIECQFRRRTNPSSRSGHDRFQKHFSVIYKHYEYTIKNQIITSVIGNFYRKLSCYFPKFKIAINNSYAIPDFLL